MILLSGCIWLYGYIFLEPLLFENFNNDGVAVRKFIDIFKKEVEVEISRGNFKNLAELRNHEEVHDTFEADICHEMIVKNPIIRVSTKDDDDDDTDNFA